MRVFDALAVFDRTPVAGDVIDRVADGDGLRRLHDDDALLHRRRRCRTARALPVGRVMSRTATPANFTVASLSTTWLSRGALHADLAEADALDVLRNAADDDVRLPC